MNNPPCGPFDRAFGEPFGVAQGPEPVEGLRVASGVERLTAPVVKSSSEAPSLSRGFDSAPPSWASPQD